MAICLSHISALQALRETRSKGCRPKEARKRIPKSTSIREVEALITKAGFLRPLPPEGKVPILVSSQSSRSKSTKTVTHVCANNAVATIALAKPRGIFIPNLGFLFVQLAQCAPFLTLIEIGYELCGSYTILPDESTFIQCEPAANRNHLAKETRALRGMRGREIAMRALQFVADNSASPMETKLTMFLCLKRTMGGYGLPFPKLNFPIEPTSAARKAAHKQRYVLDLYWPKRKIDVEYDSDREHSDASRALRDVHRRNIFLSYGVKTFGRNSNNGNARATLQCSFFRPHSKDHRNINRGKIAENKPTLDQPKTDASLRPIEKRNKTERKGNST